MHPYNIKKIEGKFHPITGHEGPEGEYRHSSSLSLKSVVDEVGGQRHAPTALPPVKTRYPLHRRLGGPRGKAGRMRKISPAPAFETRTVRPVAGLYTD